MHIRMIGRVIMVAGSLATAIALAVLHYTNAGNGGQTLWQLTTREPLIVTLVAVGAAGLAFASLFADAVILPVLAAGCCFWLFGQNFFAGQASYAGLKAGYWVPAAASCIASIGAVLSMTGYRVGTPRPVVGSTEVPHPRATAMPPVPVATAPPPGWYPDPSEPGRLRYWSGNSWTEQVQG